MSSYIQLPYGFRKKSEPPPAGGSSAPPMREAEMDPSFRRSAEAADPSARKDLRKMFDETYGQKEPADPFSPEFWEDVFDDPFDAVQHKTEKEVLEPREDLNLDDLPSPPDDFLEQTPAEKAPLVDTFARPLTKMLDGQTIEITPKKQDIVEKQLSEQLQALFPDIDKISKENQKHDVKVDLEDLTKTLSEIGGSEIVPFEFEFFHGGPNEKFSEIIRSLVPNTDNLEFLDFLQSNICKKILLDNKLKIHVETGNIYYDNTDTNESIHEFIIAQQNPISGTIDHTFTFDRDYATYFEWLINGFSAPKKQKLDIFKNKNSKFLFYHFNDCLQQNGQELKKIKPSVVTQDYIAAQEIQDKNWQYFVESVLSYSDEPKEKESQKPFQLDTLENVTVLKKTYEKLYDTVAKQFNTTLQKLPVELSQQINNDFRHENFDVREAENLDSWVAFYYKYGRFPGNSELTILPQSQNPKLIDPLSVGLSRVDLYDKFSAGDAKGFLFFSGDCCFIYLLWR